MPKEGRDYETTSTLSRIYFGIKSEKDPNAPARGIPIRLQYGFIEIYGKRKRMQRDLLQGLARRIEEIGIRFTGKKFYLVIRQYKRHSFQ